MPWCRVRLALLSFTVPHVGLSTRTGPASLEYLAFKFCAEGPRQRPNVNEPGHRDSGHRGQREGGWGPRPYLKKTKNPKPKNTTLRPRACPVAQAGARFIISTTTRERASNIRKGPSGYLVSIHPPSNVPLMRTLVSRTCHLPSAMTSCTRSRVRADPVIFARTG